MAPRCCRVLHKINYPIPQYKKYFFLKNEYLCSIKSSLEPSVISLWLPPRPWTCLQRSLKKKKKEEENERTCNQSKLWQMAAILQTNILTNLHHFLWWLVDYAGHNFVLREGFHFVFCSILVSWLIRHTWYSPYVLKSLSISLSLSLYYVFNLKGGHWGGGKPG